MDWLLVHASVQVFGFFGTLIVGVAHHLLPRFAFAALLAAVILRTAQALAVYEWPGLRPAVALSGVLARIALACVAANLTAAMGRRAVRP
ncbi:MAG TPA: hypothetical protein VFV05_14250 [Methylomirabilota bacterium]|nr:hypothetical protein [Methylomirabilota bacterium]